MNGIALVSSGPDSVAAALVAECKRWLFVDYGQVFLQQESDAYAYLQSLDLGVHFYRARISGGLERRGITVVDRNEQLVRSALDHAYMNALVDRVCLGTRCIHPWFDKHGDCTPQWARKIEKKYSCDIVQPVTGWPKWLIRRYLRGCGVNPNKLYCSEGIAP